MKSKPIFKRDTKGNVRTWSYEVVNDSWRTHAGIQGGAVVTSGWTVCIPRSQDTAHDQALFEAKAEEKKKLKRDYHRDIQGIDTPLYFKPMLAKKYEYVDEFPVYSQPKLDGIRCIATPHGLFSRKGELILGVPHIAEALKPTFNRNSGLVLDGELYNHDLRDDFNQITSIVRKKAPSRSEIELSAELIQYHVYDAPSVVGCFSYRYSRLVRLFSREAHPVVLVDTDMATAQEHLDSSYEKWLSQGYEGQMVRTDSTAYEQKRTYALLKRKEFVTEEYTISRIGEGVGNWAGYAKWVEFIMPGDKRLENGDRPRAGIKGNQEFAKDLLKRAKKLVGKPVTIKYFALTPGGIPRFPIAIDFDRDD